MLLESGRQVGAVIHVVDADRHAHDLLIEVDNQGSGTFGDVGKPVVCRDVAAVTIQSGGGIELIEEFTVVYVPIGAAVHRLHGFENHSGIL